MDIRKEISNFAAATFRRVFARSFAETPEEALIIEEALNDAVREASRAKLYKYKVVEVGRDRLDLTASALCDWGKRGWRLVTMNEGWAIFEMDYYQIETWPEEKDEDAL